jgi:hypothetical protein
MSKPSVTPITWADLHPQPADALSPAGACAVCWHPLCDGVFPGDALLCEGCGTTWMHYSCMLSLPVDAAVIARLGARLEALFAQLADRAGEDLDRMAALAAGMKLRDRLAALCPGCRS